MSDIKDLHIVVIGAGMGGLAAALALAKKGFTHIDVHEAASNLGFVGAGIQMAPNMARVLDRLGCWEEIFREATDVKETRILQGADDTEMAHVLLPQIKEKYGYPHCVGHRSTLAGVMYEHCKKEKAINFHFASRVAELKSFVPKPTIAIEPRKGGDPYDLKCDILIAADGIKSVIRPSILKEINVEADVVDSGQASYRIMLTEDQMKDDPELMKLLKTDAVTRWIGEKRHIIAYPVASKTIYNISTAHPDINFAAAPSATYTTRGDKKDMLDTYKTFQSKRVQKMLNMVPDGEICEWKLRVHHPLPTWVHGSVALLGDSAHPTLPHMNQGAAQAIEDAGSVAVALSLLPDTLPESVNKALQIYQQVRKDRADVIVEMAAVSGKTMQLGEGKEKEERDKMFAALREKKGGGPVPDKWADAEVQKMIYGFDCEKETEKAFNESFKGLSAQL